MKNFLPEAGFSGRLIRRLAVLLVIWAAGLGIVRAQQAQQTIAVNFRNATVQQVFTWLDNHTQYDFVYNNSQIESLPRVSIQMNNTTVVEVVKHCLRNSSLSYQIRGNMVIIRQSVKRFSAEFIGRKIRLDYEPADYTLVTDEKWLAFVLEQLLSNALKYTRAGGVRIFLEHETLCIADTGIGIAPEDLPRIFEKGYTGYNGRGDQKASGLGLYLCRTICRKLGHSITAESAPDEGTAIRIGLSQRQIRE